MQIYDNGMKVLKDDDQERLQVESVLRVLEHVGSKAQGVERALFDTLYEERKRLEKVRDKTKATEQRKFYDVIQNEALHANADRQRELLKQVITLFASEVAGHFDPRFYALATKVVPGGLNALLNALSPIKLMQTVTQGFSTLDNRVVLTGETELIKKVSKMGTVVMLPTHSSNLDSILIGFGLMRLGLPPFLYGAGLNLFEHKILGVFMHNLGAYKVD